MAEPKPQTGREHEVGTLTAPLLTLDLNREIEQLRSERRWQSGHTAKTLAKYSDFRVVHFVFRKIATHEAAPLTHVHALQQVIRSEDHISVEKHTAIWKAIEDPLVEIALLCIGHKVVEGKR